MQPLQKVRLKKNEDRRIRAGHLWIYSNEIDTQINPLKSFKAGEEVIFEAHDKTPLGMGYINPQSLISGRIMSRRISDRLDETFFITKINSALSLRLNIFSQPYYRLIFGESDGLPGLVIDRFNQIFVIQMNTAGIDAQSDSIIGALLKIFPDTTGILLRNDSPARLQEGLATEVRIAFGVVPDFVTLEENNAVFHAPLLTGQKTGWFYDHRYNRANILKYVTGKKVLDVFSYLGAWGIQAAKYGAQKVTCIDSSALAVECIQNNATLNGLSNVEVICRDAFEALKQLQGKEQFDIVILDPPAFVKKQKDLKEGLLAYQRINELALKLLVDNGLLVSCSCSMHVTEDDLLQAIRKASLRSHCQLQIIERGHQAQDHPIHLAIPETDYLKMLVCRRIALSN